MDFPALRARAHISGPIGPVDFPALRARAHLSASGARCGLRFAVDWWIRGVGRGGTGLIVAPSHCGGGVLHASHPADAFQVRAGGV